MACKCEDSKNKKAEADGDCPDGQVMKDGKCVAKEELGDPAPTTGEPAQADTGAVAKVEPQSCPDGHTWDSQKEACVPTNPDKSPGDDGAATNALGNENVPKWADEIIQKLKAFEELNGSKGTVPKPTARVGTGNQTYKTMAEVAKEYPEGLRTAGKYEFTITESSLRNVQVATIDNGVNITERMRNRPLDISKEGVSTSLTEAVVISGTHATQDLDTSVAIVPGGISFQPVFQFAKVKRIKSDSDRARFFKTTIPANGSQTVGSTPSEATQTFTSIEVTPSTITGTYLVGDFDEIEDSPFDLLQAIVEGTAMTYEDFVATDMLTTVSAEGTLTPGLWIRGDTGATITSSDTASVALDETGVAYGRAYLSNQGYLRGGVKPILFLHDDQWRELVTSTNVTSLATNSLPDIWVNARLEHFFGCQLVVTNAIENKTDQTNNAYNAVMCIPQHSYGIGIKRDVTVKMHEIPEDNQVRVNTTWRTKSGVIDSASIVRISTTAP